MERPSLELTDYEEIILPRRNCLVIDWRSLLFYRDLVVMLVWRDFSVNHKQTILGPLWAIFRPLSTALVFTIVFTRIAEIPTDGLPPMLFYLCGLLGWNYFAEILSATSSTFQANAHILEKVYFPRLVLPLSTVISALFTFAIQCGVFIVWFCYFYFFTNFGGQLIIERQMLLVPILLFHAAANAMGIGLLIASATVRFRDLLHALSLLMQLWMYLTPVIYPLSKAPGRYRWMVDLNPMTPVIEAFRYALLGRGNFNALSYGLHFGAAIGILLVGIFVFQRVERDFIDSI